ncbi:MAG: starch synthase [Anaerolineae bacterium CG2_30_64_16]|nr:MAG: starch synthase [Anaerolineae bacterium CG2_30_64_16]
MKILYLSAEVVPFAKTGGLADVAGALPKAIRALGHDIRVVMPRYGRVDVEKFGLKRVLDAVNVPMDERVEQAAILEGSIGTGATETPVYFVDSARYFDRQGIYMYPDDAERFIFFSRAALEMCRALDWRPDVIHCNEWHTALLPNWLKTVYRADPACAEVATLYTAHNLEYQGVFGYRVLEIAGLAEMGYIAHPDVAPDLNYVVDLMARGLLFADIINTVSETYAQEILTPEYGQRLDPILRDRRDRLFGILNGIDTELYDPATDPHIAAQFDLNRIAARGANKAALQAEAGLPTRGDVPLVGVVSRLTDQKGFDLISAVADPLIQQLGCQFVVMGTGELRYHDMLNALAARYPEQVKVFLTFNRPLEQRIYASSDIFLMPSRFEPCGLNQMVAMRYGAVPVVHAVGGLADSVADYTPETGLGNGFSFVRYDPMALYTALVRAVEAYRHRDLWAELVRRCMMTDFSWDRSAEKYVDLYHRALAIRREAPRTLEDYALRR